MGIIVGWLFLVLMVIGFQFFWWRKLKDDYEHSTIIGLGWAAIIVYMLGGVVGVAGESFRVGTVLGWWNKDLFSPVWGLILAQGVVIWSAWIRDWKLWSVAEDVSVGFYGLTGIIQVVQWVWGGGGWRDLVITFAALGLFRYLSANYRKWAWYPSGKKGFVFFAINALYLLGMTVNWIEPSGTAGEMIKTGLLAIMALIMMGGLVILGRQ